MLVKPKKKRDDLEYPSVIKALLLDDDQIFCRLLQKDIEKSEELVLEATSKTNIFLNLLEKHRYDICIIDHNLFDDTGLNILRRVRTFSDIPAILISSSYSAASHIQTHSQDHHSFDKFMSKWEDPSEIVRHSLNVCHQHKKID